MTDFEAILHGYQDVPEGMVSIHYIVPIDGYKQYDSCIRIDVILGYIYWFFDADGNSLGNRYVSKENDGRLTIWDIINYKTH